MMNFGGRHNFSSGNVSQIADIFDLPEAKKAVRNFEEHGGDRETGAYKESDAGADLFKEGRYTEAIGQYIKAAMLKPGECYFYTNIAQCHNLMGQHAEAIKGVLKIRQIFEL